VGGAAGLLLGLSFLLGKSVWLITRIPKAHAIEEKMRRPKVSDIITWND
jgi:hypothetical protein